MIRNETAQRILYCDGAPSRTVPLFVSGQSEDRSVLESLVGKWFRRIRQRYDELITKFALIRPSADVWHDIDYTFVQVVPSAVNSGEFRCDFAGSCGHSAAVAAVAAARRWEWLGPLVPGKRVRVHVTNTDDSVCFDVRSCEADRVCLDAQYLIERSVRQLLPTGEAVSTLGGVRATLVSAGNGYVFVDARALGVATAEELFRAGDDLYERMQNIRREGAVRVQSDSAIFPKIACFLPHEDGLAIRAISVPRWHPSLALTGLVALTAAAAVPGTVVADALAEVGGKLGDLKVRTPAGRVRAGCVHRTINGTRFIDCVTVQDKTVFTDGRGFNGCQLSRKQSRRTRTRATPRIGARI